VACRRDNVPADAAGQFGTSPLDLPELLNDGPTPANPSFAVPAGFSRLAGRISFAFNAGIGETGQVKTLPLF
jgi:hypothetical protein